MDRIRIKFIYKKLDKRTWTSLDPLVIVIPYFFVLAKLLFRVKFFLLTFLKSSILPWPATTLTDSEPRIFRSEPERLLLAILLRACNEVQDRVELLLSSREQVEPCLEPKIIMKGVLDSLKNSCPEIGFIGPSEYQKTFNFFQASYS